MSKFATRAWLAAEDASYGEVSQPAVLLVGLAALGLCGWWLLLKLLGDPYSAYPNPPPSTEAQSTLGGVQSGRPLGRGMKSLLDTEEASFTGTYLPFTQSPVAGRAIPQDSVAALSLERGARALTAVEVTGTFEEFAHLLAERQGKLSPEELAAFLSWIRGLATGGSTAMAGLRDFLMSGVDAPLIKASGAPSRLRVAALEALRGMGSAEAVGLALEVLVKTREPLEVVAVAELIEARAPGDYRQWVVDVARALLRQAGPAGGDGVGVGPLLKILGEAGEVTPAELEAGPGHQREYATVTLALLPDGGGIPALVGRIKGSEGAIASPEGQLALQLLAQTAGAQPRAATELVAIAREGLIPDSLWSEVARLAGGEERIQLNEPPEGAMLGRHYLYKEGGTELLYRARGQGPLDGAEVQARIELMGRLLDAGNSSAAAREALLPLMARLAGASRANQERWQ